MREMELWAAVISALLAMIGAMVWIIYQGIVKRMNRADDILEKIATAFVALALAIAPDKAPAIIQDLVKGLMKPAA